jgi:type VI protein secretion system component VasK
MWERRMSEVFSRWTWIVVVGMTLILVVPLIVVWTIIQLPPELRLVATISIILLWGVVAGYKDWVIAKRREQEDTPSRT